MIKSIARIYRIGYLFPVMKTFENITVFLAFSAMIAFALYIANSLLIFTL
jgi:hypothetical protein